MAMKQISVLALGLVLAFALRAQQTATKQKPGVEVVYITEKYIYPAQITRPSGPFLLVIKNHSRLKGLLMHVTDNVTGLSLNQADLDSVNGNYSVLLNLPPGTYKLLEPSQPGLKFTLTITK
jgi:hypothetical protein